MGEGERQGEGERKREAATKGKRKGTRSGKETRLDENCSGARSGSKTKGFIADLNDYTSMPRRPYSESLEIFRSWHMRWLQWQRRERRRCDGLPNLRLVPLHDLRRDKE